MITYTPSWVMTVAVINSSHMPGPDAKTTVNPFRDDGGAPIVLISELWQDAPAWLHDVAKALPGYDWVRLDGDADEVPGLKTYPELWK